jgi:hypothetical protein
MTIVKIDHTGLTDLLNNGGFESGKMYGVVMESPTIVKAFTASILKRIDVCDPASAEPLPVVFADDLLRICENDVSPAISKIVMVNPQLRDQHQSILDCIIHSLEAYVARPEGPLVVIVESFFPDLGFTTKEEENDFHTTLRKLREYGQQHGHVIIVALSYDKCGKELLKEDTPLTELFGGGYYNNSRRLDMQFDVMLLTRVKESAATMLMTKCRGVIFYPDKIVTVTELLC